MSAITLILYFDYIMCHYNEYSTNIQRMSNGDIIQKKLNA